MPQPCFQHVSPIEWDNVILYGQYVLGRAGPLRNGSLCCISTRMWALPYPPLRRVVARKLSINWSPEQIASWLKRAYPKDPSYHVSHETIYRSLFVQARGALKKELLAHLRSKRTIRRSRHASQKGIGRGPLRDVVSIRERPAAVEDRAVPGHWEGDLLSGSKKSSITTLVERHTRYLMLVKVSDRQTRTVVARTDQAVEEIIDRVVPVADLGSRKGTGRSSTVCPGD